MFLHLSVILFTGGGVTRTRPRGEGSRPKPGGRGCIQACTEADIPRPPGRPVLLRVVRILLECTLVLNNLFPEDISPFCGALIPLFWTIGDVCPGIQSQVDPLPWIPFTCVQRIPHISPLVQHLLTFWRPVGWMSIFYSCTRSHFFNITRMQSYGSVHTLGLTDKNQNCR